MHFYFARGPEDCVASPTCRASENRNFTWSCWVKRPHGKGEGPPKCSSDESEHHRARRWRLEVPASPSSPLMRKLARQTQTGVGEGSEVWVSPTICLSRSVKLGFLFGLVLGSYFNPTPDLWPLFNNRAFIPNIDHLIPWRRTWQHTPVFLPGESQGQRSLVGFHPWGCEESDMTVVT